MAYIDWSIVWKNDSAYSVFKQDTILRLSNEVITFNSGRTVYDARYLNDACNKLALCLAEQISQIGRLSTDPTTIQKICRC